jgi:dUTPase
MMNIPTFQFALREDVNEEKRFLPTRAEPRATGWDVRACQCDRKPLVIRPGQYVKVPLGFRAFCPEGWAYDLRPRSSTFLKRALHAHLGTIDETYPEELVLAGQYIPDISSMGQDLIIGWGEAIGQIIPVRRQEMIVAEWTNEEMETAYKERNAVRTSGFGSTDRGGK